MTSIKHSLGLAAAWLPIGVATQAPDVGSTKPTIATSVQAMSVVVLDVLHRK